MKKFDFDTRLNRLNSNSLKWQKGSQILPMWVADMDFKIAPSILEAMSQKLEKGIFGYELVGDDFYESIQKWWLKEHKLQIEKDWLVFCTGVVPAIASIIRHVSNIGDGVLIQPPVYGVFYNVIRDNGRLVVENELAYKDGVYSIDFKDLEVKLAHPKTTMMILCNPHNPIGKLWSKKDLQKIADLCEQNGVCLISDEIHCDITTKPYTPLASVYNNAITTISASKAFNLASLHASCVFTSNKLLRQKIQRAFHTDEIKEPASFATTATIAAFSHSKDWLKAMNVYVTENKKFASEFLEANSSLKVVKGEATYMLWLDFNKILQKVNDKIYKGFKNKNYSDLKSINKGFKNGDDLWVFLYKNAKIWLSQGSSFGAGGLNFMRLNVATPRSILKEGLNRLIKGIKDFENQH